jgi:hypothetical protein
MYELIERLVTRMLETYSRVQDRRNTLYEKEIAAQTRANELQAEQVRALSRLARATAMQAQAAYEARPDVYEEAPAMVSAAANGNW